MESLQVKQIVYTLPTSVDTSVFGPAYWSALHGLVNEIPCFHCRREAKSFMVFFHDMKNYELGKRIHDKKNFLNWINKISKLKQQPLILK